MRQSCSCPINDDFVGAATINAEHSQTAETLDVLHRE